MIILLLTFIFELKKVFVIKFRLILNELGVVLNWILINGL